MGKQNKDIEIEIQVQVQKIKELVAFLKKNAEFVGEFRQIDSYFTPVHKDFTKTRPIKEWLRLRESSGKYSINYKNWHYGKDGRSHFADEYETLIGDIDQFNKIFKALNLKKITVVDKKRKIWLYKNYEIALDSIKGLGNFVEIEYKGKIVNKKPHDITKDMIEFLNKFNVGEISRNFVGYPFQLMFPDEVEFEKL